MFRGRGRGSHRGPYRSGRRSWNHRPSRVIYNDPYPVYVNQPDPYPVYVEAPSPPKAIPWHLIGKKLILTSDRTPKDYDPKKYINQEHLPVPYKIMIPGESAPYPIDNNRLLVYINNEKIIDTLRYG